ncbi:MAG: helix-turn-helix domain-containing protein [Deltaproteobacteria bacterium]|nr:helix-turn-helix domain-containing protein [Deltaproteobacteria bacterium]
MDHEERTQCAAYAQEGTLGIMVWGHLSQPVASQIVELLETPAARIVVSFETVTGVDDDALLTLLSGWPRAVASVLVRPAGTIGMSIAGLAVELGEPCASARSVDDTAFVQFAASFRQSDPVALDVRCRLRECLMRHGSARSIDGVAANLAMSVRTLRRRLRAAGTSFERELKQSRLAQAKKLLARTNQPIKRIAFEVGLQGGSRLSQIFRELEGMSPQRWRALERGESTEDRCAA